MCLLESLLLVCTGYAASDAVVRVVAVGLRLHFANSPTYNDKTPFVLNLIDDISICLTFMGGVVVVVMWY